MRTKIDFPASGAPKKKKKQLRILWRLESLCDDDGSQYEEVRIELLPKHMGTNISVKENGDLVWTEGKAVWSISWWIVSILAVHLRRLYESTCEKNAQRKKNTG